MRKLVRIALAASLFLAVSQAQATLLTWVLQDVRFDDGGSAQGFFLYDPTAPCSGFCSDAVPYFDIKTNPAFDYIDEYKPTSVGGRGSVFFAHPTGIGFAAQSGAGGTALNLLFEGSLPPEGGTMPLAADANENFVEFEFIGDVISTGRRQIISGSVVGVPSVIAVPEPSSGLFLALGSGLLVLLRRRVGHHEALT